LLSWKDGLKKPYTHSSVGGLLCDRDPNSWLIPGQRLAAQKGESDDLVGAMKAQERQNASQSLSDEEED